ncbi:hypothetical protein BC567DRAFT_226161 [Phyllosticta citribraziliensis]
MTYGALRMCRGESGRNPEATRESFRSGRRCAEENGYRRAPAARAEAKLKTKRGTGARVCGWWCWLSWTKGTKTRRRRRPKIFFYRQAQQKNGVQLAGPAAGAVGLTRFIRDFQPAPTDKSLSQRGPAKLGVSHCTVLGARLDPHPLHLRRVISNGPAVLSLSSSPGALLLSLPDIGFRV